MPRTEPTLMGGDYLVPAFESAHVSDAMRPGVFTCPADISLRAVARVMATQHVHSVVVMRREDAALRPRAWGVVSDLDLVRSADAVDDLLAADLADVDVPVVTPDTPLAEAARTMAAAGKAHAVVEEPHRHEPIGMLSTLDIAGNLAWARG